MNGQDELRELWNSQPPGDKTKGEDTMAFVQKKIRKFDRMIKVRNLMECIAAVVVVGMFGWFALRSHDPFMRTGSLIVAGGAAWIIYYLLRYGRTPVSADPSQNVMDYTLALVARYDRQIRLLKSVKYWYLLPMYVGLLIIGAGVSWGRAKAGILGWSDLGQPVIYTAVFAGVWWLNEVYSVGQLQRERAKLLAMTGEREPTRREK